jgi:hypothetical protein
MCLGYVYMYVCMYVYGYVYMCRWAGGCVRVYVSLISQSLFSWACIECCEIVLLSGSNFLSKTLYSATGLYW